MLEHLEENLHRASELWFFTYYLWIKAWSVFPLLESVLKTSILAFKYRINLRYCKHDLLITLSVFYALKCKELVFQQLATNDSNMLSNYPSNSFNNVLVLMFLLHHQIICSDSWYNSFIDKYTVSGRLVIKFQITKCKFKGLAKK